MRPTLIVLLLAGLMVASGCRTERPPAPDQRAQLKAEKREAKIDALPVAPAPVSNVDDARLVLAQCGHPVSDKVLAIYNKLDNGPVRRMVFRGKQMITIDFIPSRPIAHQAADPAPFPHSPELQAELPPNSVWRFDDARVVQEDMLTTNRIAVYLPCAAAALHTEE